MKRRWFSPSLWREGVRQLTLIGIMSLVVLELCAVLVPIGIRVVAVDPLFGMNLSSSTRVQSLDGIAGIPLLVLLPTVIAPLMVLYLFRFLNSRSASDFYHQLPERRECLFLSFFAAVLFWLAVLSVIPALTSRLFFRILLAGAYVIPSGSLWIYVFNMLAGAVLAAAAAAVAMSVTGNGFNNVIGTGLLMYLPRIVLIAVVILLRESLPILSSGESLPLLDVRYNVPAGLIFGLVGNWSEVVTKPSSGVYSLVLGILYAAAALFLFVRRRSESAERAAHSPRIQRLLCIVVGFAASLLPASIITDRLLCGSEGLEDWIFWLVVMYILALVTMLIYQLITMRRFKALLRVFSAFGIVLALNVAYGLAVFGFREVVLSYTPAAEHISGVTFYSEDDFFMDRTSAPELTDPTLRRMTAELLSEHVAALRRHSFSRGSGSQSSVTVRIRSGARTVTRVLYPSDEQNVQLTKVLTTNEAVIRAYSTLPQIGSGGLSLSCSPALTDAAALPEIYETFCTEVADYAKSHFVDWYRYVRDNSGTSTLSLTVSPFTVRLTRNGSTESMNIPWEFSRTIRQYMAKLPGKDAALERVKLMESGAYWSYHFSMNACNTVPGGAELPEEDGSAYYFGDSETGDSAAICRALREMLHKAQPADDSSTVFLLAVNCYDNDGRAWSDQYYFSLPASAQPELDELVRRLNEAQQENGEPETSQEISYNSDATDAAA